MVRHLAVAIVPTAEEDVQHTRTATVHGARVTVVITKVARPASRQVRPHGAGATQATHHRRRRRRQGAGAQVQQQHEEPDKQQEKSEVQ